VLLIASTLECVNPLESSFIDVNFKLLKLLELKLKKFQGIIKGIPCKEAKQSFIYGIVGTQSDLTFVVRDVSQFMWKDGPTH